MQDQTTQQQRVEADSIQMRETMGDQVKAAISILGGQIHLGLVAMAGPGAEAEMVNILTASLTPGVNMNLKLGPEQTDMTEVTYTTQIYNKESGVEAQTNWKLVKAENMEVGNCLAVVELGTF